MFWKIYTGKPYSIGIFGTIVSVRGELDEDQLYDLNCIFDVDEFEYLISNEGILTTEIHFNGYVEASDVARVLNFDESDVSHVLFI